MEQQETISLIGSIYAFVTHGRFISWLAGILMLFGLVSLLVYLERQPDNNFAIVDCFKSKGQADLWKIANAFGLMIGGWLIISMETSNRTTWEVVAAYFAYCAGVYGVSKKFSPGVDSEQDREHAK